MNPFELDDFYYDLLMVSDIDIVETLCYTNQMANKVCHNDHFWVNKFNQDGKELPNIYPTTIDQWIEEYQKNQPIIIYY